MKKAIIPLCLILFIALAVFVYINRFDQYATIEISGIVFNNDAIYFNLVNSSDEKDITYENVEVTDVIYKSNKKYYIGEKDKKKVNLDYPIVSKDSSTLYIASNIGDLVADDFKREATYKGTLLTDSKLFNTTDFEQATDYEYYFVAMNNGVFINLSEISIKTYNSENIIPVNSFIAFSESSLNYYFLANDEYVYVTIPIIEANDIIVIDTYSGTYKDLLKKLLIIRDSVSGNIDGDDDNTNSNPNENEGSSEEIDPDITTEYAESKPEYIKKEELKGRDKTYVAPEVAIVNTYAKTYSYWGTLNISDPSTVIAKSPTFEFTIDGVVVLRKTVSSNGEFKITGLLPSTEYKVSAYYEYLDENGQKRQRKIMFNNLGFEDSFKTDTTDNLNKVDFVLGKITTDTNSFSINSVLLSNDKDDEVLNGIKGVIFKTSDGNFVLTGTEVKYLTSLIDFSYSSAKILKSNKQYKAQLSVVDTAGNSLDTNIDFINFKTKKKPPSVKMSVSTSKNFTQAALNIEINNTDDVSVSKYYYIVYNDNEEIFQDKTTINPNNKLYSINNLLSAKKYVVKAFCDYTDEDNNKYYDTEIGKIEFTSYDVDKLGIIPFSVKLNDKRSDYVTSTSASINVIYRNYADDDPIYDLLDDEVVINLINVETGDTEYSSTASKYDFVTGIDFDIYYGSNTKLKSNTEYEVLIDVGITSNNVRKPINTTINSKGFKFKTLKREAYVSLNNIYVASGFIDFDASVIDPDSAILDGNENTASNIILDIYNSDYEKVYSDYIDVSHTDNANDLINNRVTIDSLNPDEFYTFNFIAVNYNDNLNSSSNKVLIGSNVFNLSGIETNITIKEMIKTSNYNHETEKNLFDINDITRWKSTLANSYNPTERINISNENNTITLAAYNGYRVYSYYLPELKNEDIVLSFSAKRGTEREGKICIMNKVSSSQNDCIKVLDINSEGFKEFSNVTFKLNNTGYISFYVYEEENRFFTNSVVLKDFQIEVGTTSTDYKSYDSSEGYIGLFDTSGLIIKNAEEKNEDIDLNRGNYEYYISLLKDGTREKIELFNINDGDFYSGITNQIIFEHILKDESYEVRFSVYDAQLERYYDLNSVSFETDSEIRVIKSIDDFFNMHKSGYYISLVDLDFRGNTSKYTGTFNGTLDMQGHKILIDSAPSRAYLIDNLGGGGVIRNADIHFYLNNTSAKSYYYGLLYDNYGTLQNIIVTVESSTNVNNWYFSLLGWRNYGILEDFVFHSKAPVYGYKWITMGFTANYGSIRNGYAYSDDGVYAIDVSASIPQSESSQKVSGIFARSTSSGSIIENIYSTSKINIGQNPSDNDKYVGSIVGSVDSATIRNIYIYDDTSPLSNTRDKNKDIMFGSASNINYSNLFYISEVEYKNLYSQPQQLTALKNVNFQNNTINIDKKFLTNKSWRLGIFPLLDFPDCMPAQENRILPNITGDDLRFLAVDDIQYRTLEEINNSSSENNYDAKVTLSFYNPRGLTIKGITIDGIGNVELMGKASTNSDHITTVNLKLKNASEYKSFYNLNSVITNMTTIKLNTLIAMDLYLEVSSVSAITNMSGNYRIINDIDCKNGGCKNLGTYTGRINGSGHTIYNMEVPSCFISNLRGTLKNINFVNFKNTSPSARVGIVCTLESNGDIENVFAYNVNLYPKASNATIYAGGLVGYTNNGSINYSSVNYLNINSSELTNAIPNIGGLVGYGANTIIDTSFARNVNVESYSLPADNSGIGGIIGVFASGKISNVYSTGKIINNVQYLGGIVGKITGSTASVNSAISKVSIEGDQDYIGGINGYSASPSIVSKTISMGNLSTVKATAEYFDRTSGTSINRSKNFAWDKQSLNNVITTDTNGEELLKQEDLWNNVVYSSKVGFNKKWMLEDDNFRTGYIPSLVKPDGEYVKGQGYSSDSSILKDLYDENDIGDLRIFYEELFKIKSVEIINDNNTYLTNHDGDPYYLTSTTVDLLFENSHQYEIKSLVIDDIEYDVIVSPTNNSSNKTTHIKYTIRPKKYYDSYIISEVIYYDENMEEKSEKVNIVLNTPFYGRIGNASDWANIEREHYENYIIDDDLDLSSLSTEQLYKKSFSKLIGIGDKPKIKNVTLTFNTAGDSFIETIVANLTNIEFNNINISNNVKSGNNCSLIKYLNGRMNDVDFFDITVYAYYMSYVGVISINQAPEIKDIHINNINLTGVSYVGFISKSNSVPITSVTLDGVTISARGSYVGGLYGYEPWKEKGTYATYIVGNNINITATSGNYIGGIFGYGSGTKITIINSTIKGKQRVGGISGEQGNRTNNYLYVFNSKISGDLYVGGIAGRNQPIYYSLVYGSKITGNSQVGGVVGASSWPTIYSTGSVRNEVHGNDYVGGIIGYMASGSTYYDYVRDTDVSGDNNVGGIVGATSVSDNIIEYCTTNATVTATNNSAGGIIGYINNLNTTTSRYRVRLYHNIVAGSKVTAKDYAAGVVGKTQVGLYSNQFTNLLVDANVHCEKDHCNYVSGTDDSYANAISRLYVYEGSTVAINGTSTKFSDSSAYTSGKLFGSGKNSGIASLSNLKTTSFYSNMLRISGMTYDATSVRSYYPRPSHSGIQNITIPKIIEEMPTVFPVDYVNTGDSSLTLRSMGFLALPDYRLTLLGADLNKLGLASTSTYHELPNIAVYPSGINTINVEFSDVDSSTIFSYNNQDYLINEKTFTFQYDFNSDIDITIKDGLKSRVYHYSSDDLANKIYVVDNDYYYLKNNTIISNNDMSMFNNVLNIYDGNILLDDNRVYNIKDHKYNTIEINNASKVDSIPLYTYKYMDEDISTFYSYSIVNGKYYGNQLFVKNGKLEVLDSSIVNKKNRILVDEYNGNNYLLYLDLDGSLYSLKDNIVIPSQFNNVEIKDISTNASVNTDLIFVLYENDNYIVFNYKTGSIIDSNYDYKPNIFEYIGTYYNKIFSAPSLSAPIDLDYKESIELIEKINNTSIEDVLNKNKDNNVASTSNYIVKYNNKTKSYDVMEIKKQEKNSFNPDRSLIVEQLSDSSVQEVINESDELREYYNIKKHYKTFKANNVLLKIIIAVLGITILISLIILGNIIIKKLRSK